MLIVIKVIDVSKDSYPETEETYCPNNTRIAKVKNLKSIIASLREKNLSTFAKLKQKHLNKLISN